MVRGACYLVFKKTITIGCDVFFNRRAWFESTFSRILDEMYLLSFAIHIIIEVSTAAASDRGIEPDGITFLKNDGTCACMLQVNGKNAVGLLDYVLQDGDRVEVVFGFCGG